jgi:hypothetical protein
VAAGASAAIAALGLFGPASGAEASVHPDSCQQVYDYSYSSVVTSSIKSPDKTVYGQSGVTLSITEQSGTTTTGTVTGTGSYTVSAVVFSAQGQVSTSIALSKTATVSRGGSWTVPASQSQGWLADGAQGRKMHWIYHKQNGNCTFTTLGSGTANLPTLAPYIFHS